MLTMLMVLQLAAAAAQETPSTVATTPVEAARPTAEMAEATVAATQIVPEPGQPAASTHLVTLKRDTPLELMATREITTATAAAGTSFRLRINKPVEVDGRVVVPVGTWAFGEVVSASDAGGLGKRGQMEARLLHLQLGEALIPIDGDVSAKGTNSGSVAAIALVSLNPLMLFHRGNNAKIKAGEIVNAFISEDVALDLSGSAVRRAGALGSATP